MYSGSIPSRVDDRQQSLNVPFSYILTRLTRRANLTLFLILCAAALLIFNPFEQSTSAQEWRNPLWSSVETYSHVRGLRVGVVEVTAHHDEVIGSVLTVLRDLEADTTLYRPRPFMSGFDQVMADVYPQSPAPLKDLEARLQSEAPDLDALVITTCDAKFWHDFSRHFEVIIQSSVPVICLPHEMEGFDNDGNVLHLHALAIEGRLSILTLVEHASEDVRRALKKWQKEDPAWAAVPVGTFTPVFLLPDAIRSATQHQRVPNSAAILGRMINWARRYEEITAELLTAMSADPSSWGYRKQTSGDDPDLISFVPAVSNPFKLHLVGKPDPSAAPVLPAALEPVIVIHEDLGYDEFYKTIGDVDLIIPAFKKRLYHDHRASAAIPAALIARTPVLAGEDVLEAYPYLAPPGVVSYETGSTEVEAIAQLRREGIKTPGKVRDWAKYEDSLKRENMAVWAGILRPKEDAPLEQLL